MNTKISLKQKLLATGYFIDNKYLDEYIELVLQPATTDSYVEKHHIIQKQYFKLIGQPINNNSDNVVKLLYKDHCKAHWLLYFCTTGPLQKANAAAVQYILNVYKKLNILNKTKEQLTENDFNTMQQYYISICEDANSKYYSKAEIAFLKKYYPKFGIAYCAKALKRTKCSISTEIIFLGLVRETHWTDADITFLIKNYQKYGGTYCAKYLNRSKKVIFKKAMRLGLTRKAKKATVDAWSQEEINLLQTYYLIEGGLVYKRFKNRSYNACRCMASKLGLKRKK